MDTCRSSERARLLFGAHLKSASGAPNGTSGRSAPADRNHPSFGVAAAGAGSSAHVPAPGLDPLRLRAEQRGLIGAVTGGGVVILDGGEIWRDRLADVDREGAAAGEATATELDQRIRGRARDRDRLLVGPEHRHRVLEAERVRMERPGHDVACAAALDDDAGVHHGDAAVIEACQEGGVCRRCPLARRRIPASDRVREGPP